MLEFFKKNIFIFFLSSITLFIGFLTFLTFIERSFIELNQKNLQYLLIINIFLLFLLFLFIFKEIKNSIKVDIDKDGLTSNKRYITYFSLFTLIPSILISAFSLFLFFRYFYFPLLLKSISIKRYQLLLIILMN